MLPYILILFAAALRFITPYTHGAFLWNYSAVGAALLFFGSRVEKKNLWVPIVLFTATDIALNVFVYHYPVTSFQYGSLLYYGIALSLGLLLANKPSFLRVLGITLTGSTAFFVISNFMVWLGGGMYPLDFGGLIQCYTAAIPFARGTYSGDLVYVALFFGVPALLSITRHDPIEVRVTRDSQSR
jgi:hypothetical protein